MKVFVRRLNICPMRRLNITQYEIALKDLGHEVVDSADEADKVLVWTCAVRGDFHDNSVNVLRQYEQSGKSVVAAGCLPSINPGVLRDDFSGEVLPYKTDDVQFHEIFGGELARYPYPIAERPITVPLDEYRRDNPHLKIGNDDQYIKLYISEGCTMRCSYCTEVQAFPPYQSYPVEKIVRKAEELINRTGVVKLALFGDDIGAYGLDRGQTLVDLLGALLDIGSQVRISLKQIHPLRWKQYFSQLQPLIGSGRIFQLLVPIQSASSRVLRNMKRGYTRDDLDLLFGSVKGVPDLELETHIIAGFPGETAEEWEETVRFVCSHKFRYVMGNVYLAGPGTEAAAMSGQIGEGEKARRMITGAEEMERCGTVVGHNFSARQKEHITLSRPDLVDM